MTQRNYEFGETIRGVIAEITGTFDIDKDKMHFASVKLDTGETIVVNVQADRCPAVGQDFRALAAHSLYRPNHTARGLGAPGPMMPEIFNVEVCAVGLQADAPGSVFTRLGSWRALNR